MVNTQEDLSTKDMAAVAAFCEKKKPQEIAYITGKLTNIVTSADPKFSVRREMDDYASYDAIIDKGKEEKFNRLEFEHYDIEKNWHKGVAKDDKNPLYQDIPKTNVWPRGFSILARKTVGDRYDWFQKCNYNFDLFFAINKLFLDYLINNKIILPVLLQKSGLPFNTNKLTYSIPYSYIGVPEFKDYLIVNDWNLFANKLCTKTTLDHGILDKHFGISR